MFDGFCQPSGRDAFRFDFEMSSSTLTDSRSAERERYEDVEKETAAIGSWSYQQVYRCV